MYITAITHASARDKESNFRGLTRYGQEESRGAAQQYKTLAAGGNLPLIDQIVSSPKPRCLETVILFAKSLGNEAVAASSVLVDPDLAAGEIEGGELGAVAKSSDARHLLVSGHADLVKTLPAGTSLLEQTEDGGWFTVRPVLFQVEVAQNQSWQESAVLFCYGLLEGRWQSLLA